MKVTKEFAKVYNHIFEYIYLSFGPKAYEDFLRAIAPVMLEDLEAAVKEKGLDGCYAYWLNTLSNEGIVFESKREANFVTFLIKKCESLACIKQIFPLYCNHCKIMYPHILGKYGLDFKIEPDYTQSTEARSCKFRITKRSSSAQAGTRNQSKPLSPEQT